MSKTKRFIHTVDGWNPASTSWGNGSLSHLNYKVLYIQPVVGLGISEPSTVLSIFQSSMPRNSFDLWPIFGLSWLPLLESAVVKARKTKNCSFTVTKRRSWSWKWNKRWWNTKMESLLMKCMRERNTSTWYMVIIAAVQVGFLYSNCWRLRNECSRQVL